MLGYSRLGAYISSADVLLVRSSEEDMVVHGFYAANCVLSALRIAALSERLDLS
jgi:hypothetical protein